MRRAFVLLFVLVFATASEGATLCLMVLPGTADQSHGCCPNRTASSTSVETCCGISQSDRDTTPPNQADAVAVAVSTHKITFFGHTDISASAEPRSSNDSRSGSAPLYLQHLSLLI